MKESGQVNMAPVLTDAVRKFGVGAQVVKAMEEMGELVQVLSKWLLGESKDESRIHDEMADVLIMMMQLQIIFNGKEVHKRVLAKMARLEESLKDYPMCPVCGQNPKNVVLEMCPQCHNKENIGFKLSNN